MGPQQLQQDYKEMALSMRKIGQIDFSLDSDCSLYISAPGEKEASSSGLGWYTLPRPLDKSPRHQGIAINPSSSINVCVNVVMHETC